MKIRAFLSFSVEADKASALVGRAGTAAAVSTRVEMQFVNAGVMHPTGIPPDALKKGHDRVHRYTSTGEIVSAARHKSYRPCCAAEGAGIRNGDPLSYSPGRRQVLNDSSGSGIGIFQIFECPLCCH